KVTASRANPRKSGPLTVELDSIDLNGRRIQVKTNSVQPAGPPQTARQAQYGHTAGTTVVNPQTTLQFQLAAALNLYLSRTTALQTNPSCHWNFSSLTLG